MHERDLCAEHAGARRTFTPQGTQDALNLHSIDGDTVSCLPETKATTLACHAEV